VFPPPFRVSSLDDTIELYLHHLRLQADEKNRRLAGFFAYPSASKRLHHLKSPGQIYSFLEGVKKERLNQ
jgi:hypothetical protein